MGSHFKGHKEEFKKTTIWTQNLISTKFLYLTLLVSSQKKIKKVFGKISWLSVISIEEHIEIMLRPGCFIGNFTSVFKRVLAICLLQLCFALLWLNDSLSVFLLSSLNFSPPNKFPRQCWNFMNQTCLLDPFHIARWQKTVRSYT